jgi:hypothetical protein
MQALIVKLLLGRGMDKLTELVAKAIRHALTYYGGTLVAGGYVSNDDLMTVTGYTLAISGVLLSALRTFFARYK